VQRTRAAVRACVRARAHARHRIPLSGSDESLLVMGARANASAEFAAPFWKIWPR